MRIIFIILIMFSQIFSKPLIDLDGLYLYDAREVLAYNNPSDTRKTIVIFSSKSCSHCVTYKNQLTSINTQTKQYLNTKYIFGISEDDANLNQIFNITSTPTTFVFNKNKNLLVEPMVGVPQNVDEYVSYLIQISKK